MPLFGVRPVSLQLSGSLSGSDHGHVTVTKLHVCLQDDPSTLINRKRQMTTEMSTDSTAQDGDAIAPAAATTTTTSAPPAATTNQGNHNHYHSSSNEQSTNHNELSQHPRAKTFSLEKVGARAEMVDLTSAVQFSLFEGVSCFAHEPRRQCTLFCRTVWIFRSKQDFQLESIGLMSMSLPLLHKALFAKWSWVFPHTGALVEQ